MGLGLRGVAAIAARRGADARLSERIDDVLNALGFPLRRTFDAAAVVAALSTDKKRERGVQHWLLPMAVGRVVDVVDVTEDELRLAIDAIWARP